MKRYIVALASVALVVSCGKREPMSISQRAERFAEGYSDTFQELYYRSSEAEWASMTHIVQGDTTNAGKVQRANEAMAAFTGSAFNISKAQFFLSKRDSIDPLVIRQIETILYRAANNPSTVQELVSERIRMENAQSEVLYGFSYMIDDGPVTTNDIDDILRNETDIERRLKAWESSKEVGRELKEGLETLKNLRNSTVRALGYEDYFSYQVSDYQMDKMEMLDINQNLIRDIWPLYRELHTYLRYELAEKYGQPVPEMLPAHWLPNRWGQDWSSSVEVSGFDLDQVLSEKDPEWLIKKAEDFYVSLGFEELPSSFYKKSSLYPVPAGADYKKNNHASAWHMDLKEDVRCLMSIVPNAEWYETTHHELGHIYYYMAYSNDSVPILLRGGANRAYHEAIGSMLGLAAMQQPFLENAGLIPEDVEVNKVEVLLKEAMNYIVFIPFSAGVMTEFEYKLYSEELPMDLFNQTWWDLKRKYQGIEPPYERSEEFCDAATKTHINDDAAQYYDYALSYALLFQFHEHISKNILHQDPKETNYYGNKEVGKWLNGILSVGATEDWRKLLEESTGQPLSAQPMLNYFAPLMKYLQKVNEGREHTLPENI